MNGDGHFRKHYDAIHILFNTGLRISEFAGLTVSDIDFENNKIRVDHQLLNREENHHMNKVALATFSSFDTGNKPSEAEPERFYHGFVLGLMVDLADRYVITSNRESGFGRYDVMLEPLKGNGKDDAIIMEFKVHDSEDEKTLKDTVDAALAQIEEKDMQRFWKQKEFWQSVSESMDLHLKERRC